MRTLANKTDDGQFKTTWGNTSHFHESEIACKCGCGLKDISQDLVDGLERLRMRAASPIIVVSGVRCIDYNNLPRIGGAPTSQHLPDENGVGNAVDVKSPTVDSGKLYLLSLHIEQFRGRGLRASTLHVDSRDGQEAQWMYGPWKGMRPDDWISDLIRTAFTGGSQGS